MFSAQRVPVAAGGGRGGGGGGRDAAGAYDEFARPRLEQLVALSSWSAARFLRECAAADVEVSMYDAGEGVLYPTEQWTVHFFKWLRARV